MASQLSRSVNVDLISWLTSYSLSSSLDVRCLLCSSLAKSEPCSGIGKIEGDLGPDWVHFGLEDVYAGSGMCESLGHPDIGEDAIELFSEANMSGDGIVVGGNVGRDAKFVDIESR